MKNRFYLSATCSLLLIASTFATDTTSNEITMDSLLSKMEIMEAELEMVKMERSDNSLLARGATLDWGTGLNLGMYLYGPYIGSFDIGYSFAKVRRLKIKQPVITDNKNIYLLGIALQGRILILGEVFWDDDDNRTAHSLGLKCSFGTPIMLNFINFTTNVSPFIQWGELDETTSGYSEIEAGFEIASCLNFWFSKLSSVSLGFIADPTVHNIKGHNDLMNPFKFKFLFGIRYYFKGLKMLFKQGRKRKM